MPAVSEEEAPDTEMEVRGAGFTVIDMVPETEPMVAVAVTVPAFTPLTRPEALTVAMVLSELFQAT